MKMMANLLNPTSGEVWMRYEGSLEKLSKANQENSSAGIPVKYPHQAHLFS
jgi:hypothetical protein